MYELKIKPINVRFQTENLNKRSPAFPARPKSRKAAPEAIGVSGCARLTRI
jgi:hypothetical protein